MIDNQNSVDVQDEKNENEEIETSQDEEQTDVNPEELKKQLEEERQRREKAEEAIKKAKLAEKKKSLQTKSLSDNKSADDDSEFKEEITKRISNVELLEKKRQFGYENNLPPQIVDKIFSINENPSKEDLEDPFIKGGIEKLKRQERVNNNTPSSSVKSFTKTKDFEKLSKEDKNKEWQKYLKSRISK